MRKDYAPISSNGTVEEEIHFVERFWTERWEAHSRLPRVEGVAQREEYKMMLPFLSSLPTGSRILDAGCGMGEWTVFLTNQGFEVVGLDVSERTISRLRGLLPTYHFVHGDIRRMDFATGSFDACFSWGVFEHFENGLGDCINEVHRILKENAPSR